ncbi:surface antigen (D15) [Emticicia oligotrophica DSM 17448]|uniref:Surface antigen (D15) n=1 Tax=Emticicia oligotrophica (strain DSM 17448 / CIP 109782 / MTCC 6937 / GPTSA100-15) TaxID=929562 RepID=A0ABN4ASL5_EMTOG|nr:BamA/TamA family outer membrane protein [Emticicia oligotrophica]AFK04667.1 surface antigen (D15) [Emticicia oligotrophica DSM 17448]
MRYFHPILFLFLFFSANQHLCFAQNDSIGEAKVDSTNNLIKQVDAKDIIKAVFAKENALPTPAQSKVKSKSTFAILPSFNYSIVTGFMGGANTVNIFRVSPKAETKPSSIRTFTNYSQYKQLISILNTNIWTKGNKLNLLGDIRFYKFPSTTFGLGGNTTLDDANMVDYKHFRIYQVALKKISPKFDIGIGYHLDFHWKIKETNENEGLRTDLKTYGFGPKSTSSGLSFNLQHDSRDNSTNSTNGNYANFQYRYNSTLLGSNQNWQSVILDFRKYIRFPQNSENILALWSYDWISFGGDAPYFDLPSIGWDAYYNTGRGYPIGRFRGKTLLYFETEYRFSITKNGLLRGVVFGNTQSVQNYPDGGMSKIIPGGGGGIRVKWNKISNTTIAFDYGIGIGGSKGFVFNINEVF